MIVMQGKNACEYSSNCSRLHQVYVGGTDGIQLVTHKNTGGKLVRSKAKILTPLQTDRGNPSAMGCRCYLPPPPIRVHSGLHSTKQCSGCTSFHPNLLDQSTLLPEACVLVERIWMRGRALAVIANGNDENGACELHHSFIFDHGVTYPSTHPGCLFSSSPIII